ncbi:MAG: OsmC family protein [Bacteroidia bacterium]|nr:OsmC family protein [Bacteroidia bacterium]NNM22893.1 OsmC family protein [Flavobacteriaceae bacterium]
MKVTLERKNQPFHFEAKGKSGLAVNIDSSTPEASKGSSPMELLLMAIGGCNAIDIVSILNKQRQEIKGYRIELEGTRREMEQARPFEAVHLKIYLEGDIDPAKARRAAQLSFDKYCSVSISVRGCIKVSHEILINGKSID